MKDEDHDLLLDLKARFEEHRLADINIHITEDKARENAYTELQRRLTDLNHAHEEARRKEINFASKEQVDVLQKDLVRRIETDGGDIDNLKLAVLGNAENIQGNSAGKDQLRVLAYQAI